MNQTHLLIIVFVSREERRPSGPGEVVEEDLAPPSSTPPFFDALCLSIPPPLPPAKRRPLK